MGFFTKTCSICGSDIFVLGGNSLKDGCYCNQCKTRLSPFFIHQKNLTVNDICTQLNNRQNNEQLFANFVLTKTIGNQPKLLIDENNCQFAVMLNFQKGGNPTPDVIHFSQVVDCTVDIVEEKTEVKYKDHSNNLRSFSPPYYAYSYDFFVNISVNIPYIQLIRIKLNTVPIDNDQPHVIEKTGDLGQIFKDALGSARSYNGMTSNITEVQTSSTYLKYEKLANDMKYALLEGKKSLFMKKTATRCSWCGCLLNDTSSGVCMHCCGPL